MSKRIKSFFITIGAFIVTALVTVMTGPLWPAFESWITNTLGDSLLGWSVPAVVAAVVVAFVGEIIRQIVNAIIASREGYSSVVGASRNGEDTF